MIPNNRFNEIDKARMWLDHPYCVLCGSNQQCSLHHILGCKLKIHSSILNSIMLCLKCHKNADGHNVSDREFQIPLLIYTLERAVKIDYPLSEHDLEFYNTFLPYYNYNNEGK